jgi:hypothetical protein
MGPRWEPNSRNGKLEALAHCSVTRAAATAFAGFRSDAALYAIESCIRRWPCRGAPLRPQAESKPLEPLKAWLESKTTRGTTSDVMTIRTSESLAALRPAIPPLDWTVSHMRRSHTIAASATAVGKLGHYSMPLR